LAADLCPGTDGISIDSHLKHGDSSRANLFFAAIFKYVQKGASGTDLTCKIEQKSESWGTPAIASINTLRV
jgi:hypothetical protein